MMGGISIRSETTRWLSWLRETTTQEDKNKCSEVPTIYDDFEISLCETLKNYEKLLILDKDKKKQTFYCKRFYF